MVWRPPKRNRQGEKAVRTFLLVLLVATLGLSFLLLKPFLSAIILAILLAGLTYPIFRWFSDLIGGRKTVAALVMVLASVIVIVVPVFVFIFLLLSEGASIAQGAIRWIGEGRILELLELPFVVRIESWMNDVFGNTTDLREQIVDLSNQIARSFVNSGVKLFGNTVKIVSDFGVFAFVLFFLFRDGETMIEALIDLLPMRRPHSERIITQVNDVTRAVLLGTFVVALVQGVLGAIGLMIVGIPGLVWGTVIGFSSMIPLVGTFLITLPVTVYLFASELYWQGIFFGIWALLVVGGIDNVLRPFLMKGRARMSPFFVFLGVIGGISYFGMPGLIYGPMTIALSMVMLSITRSEFSDTLRHSRRSRGS